MTIQAPPALELPAALASRGLSLRQAADADLPFQRILFETARTDAALFAALSDGMRAPFLDQQFGFQTRHYAQAYAKADRLIVLKDGEAIGRLILERAADEWCVVDIALLPAWRGAGIGTLLLQGVQAAAAKSGAGRLHLMVEMTNPARRLYARLGFAVVEEAMPNVAMIWPAQAPQLKMA